MKYIAIYLVCFLIFIGWLLYEQRKSRKVAEQESKDFWAFMYPKKKSLWPTQIMILYYIMSDR